MKKVLFAMLVSGMLFSCTNNNSEDTTTTDSTAVIEGSIPVETEELESAEIEATSAEVEADSAATVVE